MGNGFPGLAVFSVIALLVALAVVALASLQPWAANSVAPHLSVPPAADIGLGDSVAVAPAASVDVGNAAVAAVRKVSMVAEPAPTHAGEHASEPAIAPARVVARPESAAAPKAPPQPQAAPPITPVAAPTPAPEASPPSPAPPVPVAMGNGAAPPPIAAGVGTPADTAVALQVHEGDEYALSFSFSVEPTAYRLPGSENLVVRFKGETSESPSFGLQLWDDGSGSGRGLWSSGEAMGGERFLAPVEDFVGHELSVDFRASSEGEGFYLICLDGRPIDVGAGVDLIDPGADDALLEVGLFRDGEAVQGSSEIRFEAVKLGEPEPALP